METKIYAAYGSNMNLKQMAGRCPAAKMTGTGMLINYRLTFRQGVANIEPARGRKVPILLWEITPECETALDRYEGYPRLYTKKTITVTQEDGTKVKAMAYIMTAGYENLPGLPSTYYLKTIQDGYRANKLPMSYLREAVAENCRECAERDSKRRKPWNLTPWRRESEDTTADEVHLTAEIAEQITEIRREGKFNMLDTNEIQNEAYDRGFNDLIYLIQEKPAEYLNFVQTVESTGKED